MPTKVSIVEDDDVSRSLWADWVHRAPGFSCTNNYGSAEAAEPAILHEHPDVVLMDINLPGRSGIECVRRLKPLAPKIQFVMLTVYSDADHIFAALATGATGYLLKRTDRTTLLAALKEVQGGGSPMTSTVARQVVQFFQSNRDVVPELDRLSSREQEVLHLLARGRQNKEIVAELAISQSTVATHIRRIYEKLHVHSRAEAVGKFAGMGRR